MFKTIEESVEVFKRIHFNSMLKFILHLSLHEHEKLLADQNLNISSLNTKKFPEATEKYLEMMVKIIDALPRSSKINSMMKVLGLTEEEFAEIKKENFRKLSNLLKKEDS